MAFTIISEGNCGSGRPRRFIAYPRLGPWTGFAGLKTPMVTHTACLLGVGETLLYVIRCRELVGSDLHDSRAGRLGTTTRKQSRAQWPLMLTTCSYQR